jgi:hypothetical protein
LLGDNAIGRSQIRETSKAIILRESVAWCFGAM